MMVNTDAEFNEIVISKKDVTCRSCKHFHRIEQGTRKAHHWQGFCDLGQLKSDYGLYVSSSAAKSCKGFALSDYNLETKQLEHEIEMEICDLRIERCDGRSKTSRAIKEFSEKIKDIGTETIGPLDRSTSWFILQDVLKERKVLYDWYYFTRLEKFKVLAKRHALKESQYFTIMACLASTVDAALNSVNADYRNKEAENYQPLINESVAGE